MRSARTMWIALSILAATTAAAHHGWSGYDSSKALDLSGTIEDSSYENPHGLATLKTPQGAWRVVLAPVSRMQARGLTREMLKPGTEVSVQGYPHNDNEGELRAERITVAGKTVELR